MLKKLLQTTLALCITGASLKAQCPVASAGPDQSICVGTTSTVTLNAVLPASFTGTWTKVGGFFTQGTITAASSPTSTVTGLTTAATLRMVWTLSDGASCTGIRDTVIINVLSPATTANAGSNKTICAGGTATLGATAPPAGSIGTWTYLDGSNNPTLSITDINDRASTITGLNVTGRDSLAWTVTNTFCGGSKTDTVVIITNPAPTVANAGVNKQTCQGDTVQLIGNTPTVGTPSWTLPFGSGAAFYPTNANNDTVGVRGTTARGNVSVAYRIATGTGTNFTVLNGCVSTDTMIVTFTSANAGADIKLCKTGPGTVRMAATPLNPGETGQWTFIRRSGSEAITSPSSYSTTITAITSDTLTLRWTVTAGGCSDFDDMNVIVLGALPTVASVGNDITGCVVPFN